MKKIVAVLLSVAMLFALSSCAKNDGGDKAELSKNYAAATQKTAELTSMDADMDMKMNMEVGGEKMDMNMKMDIMVASEGENDGDMAMSMTMDAQGQKVEMGMYYTDGYMYMNLLGQKMKAKVDMQTAEKQMGNQTSEYLDLNPEDFLTLTMKKTGDDVVYSFKGDPKKLSALTDAMTKQIKQQLESSGMSGLTVTVKDISGTTTVNKDGYVSKQDITIDCEMTVQGQTAKLSMTMDMVYNNPGQAVTVEFPDFEGYSEVDASSLTNAA